jgi:beta-lactamase superfamily II metal-dependent hydrolase
MRFPRFLAIVLLGFSVLAAAPSRSATERADGQLKIAFIDVEGGAATLIVTPLGESVLIDTGWEREDGRDALRIREAAQALGARRIDHLITTHWHLDHYGGLAHLAKLMPVGRFYDRGIPEQLSDDPRNFPRLIAAYRDAGGQRSRPLQPGDTIPLRQPPSDRLPRLTLRCIASDGRVLGEGGQPAPDGCPAHPAKAPDNSDNARSIAVLLKYGDFSFWAGGDLTWNTEHRLACPINRVGAVSLYLTDHHGANSSNNPALVNALSPRVAVMNCGARKGGDRETTTTLRAVPGLRAIYQSHRAERFGADGNAPAEFVANRESACQGIPIVAEVDPDGKRFEVRVGWNGQPRRFVSLGE